MAKIKKNESSEIKKSSKGERTVVDKKIVVKNLEGLLKLVEGDFKVIFLEMKKRNHKYFEGINFERTLDSKKDLKLFVRDTIIEFLKNEYEDLVDEVSDLRKKGSRLFFFSMKLMSAHLKIKLFRVMPNKKEFDKILEIFDKVKIGLDKFSIKNLHHPK